MFADFYGLSIDPFNANSPGHIYLGSAHRKVLADLYYGIEAGNAIQLLVAESGLGKTMLLHSLLHRLRSHAQALLLSSIDLRDRELLGQILNNLKYGSAVELPSESKEEIADSPTGEKKARPCILLIDDAQELGASELSGLFQLCERELSGTNKVNAVLCGRPELLARSKPLKGAGDCQELWIDGFSAIETERYISHRMHLAGNLQELIFTPEAAAIIARRSGGVPQKINALCGEALVEGFKRGIKQIDASIWNENGDKAKSATVQVLKRPTHVLGPPLLTEVFRHILRAWPLSALILACGIGVWFERKGFEQMLSGPSGRTAEPANPPAKALTQDTAHITSADNQVGPQRLATSPSKPLEAIKFKASPAAPRATVTDTPNVLSQSPDAEREVLPPMRSSSAPPTSSASPASIATTPAQSSSLPQFVPSKQRDLRGQFQTSTPSQGAITAEDMQKIRLATDEGDDDMRLGQAPNEVYIHIRSGRQQAAASRIREKLMQDGYLVPRIIMVSFGPNENQVRYFHDDRARAGLVADELRTIGLKPIAVERIGHYGSNPPKRYELWLAPSAR